MDKLKRVTAVIAGRCTRRQACWPGQEVAVSQTMGGRGRPVPDPPGPGVLPPPGHLQKLPWVATTWPLARESGLGQPVVI